MTVQLYLHSRQVTIIGRPVAHCGERDATRTMTRVCKSVDVQSQSDFETEHCSVFLVFP